MSLMFAMTSYELLPRKVASPTQTAMSVSASIVNGYYLCRLGVFTVTGPDGNLFSTYLNSEITLLINLMLLVVVSFSMSLLSQQQSITDLRTRATRDGLTGLLNRTEFLALATQEIRRIKPSGIDAALILADLDHFKDINDTFGHTAGDHALRTFAAVCRDTVRSTDLVGRYGGDEFIFLLTGTSLGRAEEITAEISRQLHEMESSGGNHLPAVSYGIVSSAHDDDISAMIVAADAALYQAKLRGRDQAVLQHQELDDVGMPDSAL